MGIRASILATSISMTRMCEAAPSAGSLPMVNWYLSDNVRLEMAYGYGHLNRFDLKGNTHFFQTRLQLQF